MAVFFEDSAMRCFHTTLRLGNQGCRTVLARIHVGWLFFFKNPVLTGYRYELYGMVLSCITSSTAQGGGGSFKNRKPIGEVRCCESRMAGESADGPTGGWSCVFWRGFNGCSGHLTTTVGFSVAYCSCSCSCSVV